MIQHKVTLFKQTNKQSKTKQKYQYTIYLKPPVFNIHPPCELMRIIAVIVLVLVRIHLEEVSLSSLLFFLDTIQDKIKSNKLG